MKKVSIVDDCLRAIVQFHTLCHTPFCTFISARMRVLTVAICASFERMWPHARVFVSFYNYTD